MMLTGKAKEDFYCYVFNNIKEQLFGDLQDVCDYIYSLPISCKHALIIEWFDSSGIYVCVYTEEIFEYNGFYAYVNESNLNTIFSTRQEATKQAILKANQIYNELSR